MSHKRRNKNNDTLEPTRKKQKISTSLTINNDNTRTPIMHGKNINLFWKYIIERHNIYKKRNNNESPPYTNDKILSKWRFTNVFRDIDPGTQYVIKKIIPKFKNDFENLLFNVLIYRIYNKINTFNKIGFQDIKAFNKIELDKNLRTLVSNNEKVFTNAFVVPSYRFIDKDNKYDKIGRTCILFEKIKDIIPKLCKNISQKNNSEYTYKQLLALPGIGKFMGYQISVDLGYWNKNIFNEYEYVIAGPGAINGINRLFEDKKNLNHDQCIQYLCKIQKKGFLENGCDVNILFMDRKEKYLNLMAMENCLCEISKYLKAYYEEGRPKNKFDTPKQ
eukprot:286063_1